jgi:hypothetical protein
VAPCNPADTGGHVRARVSGANDYASYVLDRGKHTRLTSPRQDHPHVMVQAASPGGPIAGQARSADFQHAVFVVWVEGSLVDLTAAISAAGPPRGEEPPWDQ